MGSASRFSKGSGSGRWLSSSRLIQCHPKKQPQLAGRLGWIQPVPLVRCDHHQLQVLYLQVLHLWVLLQKKGLG
jgi:hypothetical protein